MNKYHALLCRETINTVSRFFLGKLFPFIFHFFKNILLFCMQKKLRCDFRMQKQILLMCFSFDSIPGIDSIYFLITFNMNMMYIVMQCSDFLLGFYKLMHFFMLNVIEEASGASVKEGNPHFRNKSLKSST